VILVKVNELPPGTPSALKRKKLRDARRAARTGLKVFAGWLKSAGAPDSEVQALRDAWKALPEE